MAYKKSRILLTGQDDKLMATDVVKGTTFYWDCFLNDDIEFAIMSLWPTTPITSTTADQVDPDATLINP